MSNLQQEASARTSAGAVDLLARIAVGILFAVVTYGLPLAALREHGETAASAVAILTSLLFSVLALSWGFSSYLYYWMSMVLLQNATVGLWLPDTFQGSVPFIITEAKTLSLVFALLLSAKAIALFLQRNPRIAAAAVIYFAWVALSVRDLQTTAIAYGRNFLFPLLLLILVAARTSSMSRAERISLLRRLVGYTIVILTIGVIAESLAGTQQWRTLMNSDKLASLGGVSDTTRFFGLRVERVAGFIIEPTNAGYLAATCAVLLVLLAIVARKLPTITWWIALALALWLLLESTARSGFLMLALALIAIVLSRTKLRTTALYFAGVCSAFAIVLAYVAIVKSPAAVIQAFSDPVSIVGGDSTTYHLGGLMAGVDGGFRTIIGHGLGVGGNFSGIDSAEEGLRGPDKVATGGESAWGVLSYQTGIIGLILLLIVIIVIGSRWGRLSLTTLVVWSVTSMFAEASFGLQVACLLMVGATLLRDDKPVDHLRTEGDRHLSLSARVRSTT